MTTTIGPLAEVPVAAGILQATSQLLAQLAEFFDMHPDARVALGHFWPPVTLTPATRPSRALSRPAN